MNAVSTIIDAHAHVASTRFIPRPFIQGVVDNVIAQLAGQGIQGRSSAIMDMYLSKLQDHDCDDMVHEMDAAGFSRSILLLPDYTHALPVAGLSIAEMFACHRAILDRHPERFHAFVGVDPRWGRDGVELFEHGLRDLHFHGLKLYPPCGYLPGDRSLYPFYELCRAYRVPVLSHIGPTSPALRFDTSVPLMFDQPARDFPDVDFILAHGGVHYVDESIMMCRHRPNLFLDVSGFAVGGASSIDRVLRAGIPHKVLFGTDWPVFRLQGSQKAIFAATFADGPLPECFDSAREIFFSGNIRRLLAKRRAVEQSQAASEPREEPKELPGWRHPSNP